VSDGGTTTTDSADNLAKPNTALPASFKATDGEGGDLNQLRQHTLF